MNSTVNEITKSITGKPSLNECSVDELQQLTNQYPFYGPAQFLLVKKLKCESSPLLASHVQKALLYFQNQVWLNYQLTDAATNQIFTQKEEVTFSTPAAESKISITPEETVDETKLEDPDETIAGEQDEDEQDQPVLEIPKLKIEPIDPSITSLVFEPYHTIDYFASQGIKPKEEEKPKDQLSRQLKSFTEWLKVMKRLPVSEISAAVSATDEKNVEKMAEVSINDREVLTETMAEVWEKQGNAAKATEIYQKLSLLNPGKSSYFAAKIEQLKNL